MYITRCVDISVVVRLTFGAIPFTDIQRQRFNDMSAGATALTARKPAVNLYQSTPYPLALIVKLAHQFAPSGVRNTLCKFGVLHHIQNFQVLNNHDLVFKAPVESSVYGENLYGYQQFCRGQELLVFVLYAD